MSARPLVVIAVATGVFVGGKVLFTLPPDSIVGQVANAMLGLSPERTLMQIDRSGSAPKDAVAVAGLDAPFVIRPNERLEAFPARLGLARAGLPPQERRELDEAKAFFSFCVLMEHREEIADDHATLRERERRARVLAKMHEFAKRHATAMTLRRYVDEAARVKEAKPAWRAAYEAHQRASGGRSDLPRLDQPVVDL